MTILVIVLPVALYMNTVWNGYTVDDDIVILRNEFTQRGLVGVGDIFSHDAFDGAGIAKGVLGPGRYRPLSIATFAIEWEFLGLKPGDEVDVTGEDGASYRGRIAAVQPVEERATAIVSYVDRGGQTRSAEVLLETMLIEQTSLPKVSHLLNVLLFASSVWVLFLVLRQLFAGSGNPVRELVPLFAAVLFAAHPIHAEAVANIKGRDEILALLFGMLALLWAIRFAKSGKGKWIALSVPAFLLALLAKESSYPLVAVVPIAAIVFMKDNVRRRMMTVTLPLLVTAVVGVLVRNSVVGFQMTESSELMNNPFLDATGEQRIATIFFVLGKYLQLLVFPHPLTNDYYPYHIALKTFADPQTLLALFLNLGLGIYGLWLTFSKKHPLGFAILFYFLTISIVSNIVLPVGTFMSERLVFIPSVGFCLAVTWLLSRIGKGQVATENFSAFLNGLVRNRPLGLAILVVVLAGYSFKTVTRNMNWKDNLTLFTKDIEVSHNSAKANNAAGGVLFHHAKTVTDSLERREILTRSMQYLERAVEIHPKYKPAWITLGNDYFYLGKDMSQVVHAYRQHGGEQAYKNLEIIAGQALDIGRFEDAIIAYTMLHERAPNEARYLTGLGRAHGQGRNDFNTAITYLNKAVELSPNDIEALKHLGTSYALRSHLYLSTGNSREAVNDIQQAIGYFLRAEQLNPNDVMLLRNIATAYASIGRKDEAQRYMQRAEQMGGRN